MMRKTVAFLLLAFVFIGCIKEDTENCLSGLELSFKFTLHTYPDDGDRFGKDVRYVNVYLFDNNGVLRATKQDQGEMVGGDYKMMIDIPAGRYTIVAWAGGGNRFTDAYLTEGVEVGSSTIDDFRMKLRCVSLKDNTTPEVTDFDDLFFGAAGSRTTDGSSVFQIKQVDVASGVYVHQEIELIRNTNMVSLTIEGMEHLAKSSDMNIWISAVNTAYKYNNAIQDSPQVHYAFNSVDSEPGTIKGFIKIQRLEWNLKSENPVMLNILNVATGKLIEINLLKTLADVTDDKGKSLYTCQEDLDRIYEHPIKIEIQKDLSLRVFVRGWEIITIKPA